MFHGLAALSYLLVTVGLPLLLLSKSASSQAAIEWITTHFFIGFLWLAATALSLPLFIWCERLAFDNWIGGIKDDKKKKKLTERFELNAKHMEVFWKTVAGIYAAAGLFSVTQQSNNNASEELTKEDIAALKKAFNHVAELAAKKLPAEKADDTVKRTSSGEASTTSVSQEAAVIAPIKEN